MTGYEAPDGSGLGFGVFGSSAKEFIGFREEGNIIVVADADGIHEIPRTSDVRVRMYTENGPQEFYARDLPYPDTSMM